MEKMDMAEKVPVRRISSQTKAEDKAIKQEGYDILYKAEIDMYTKAQARRQHEQNIFSDLPATL
jgi:hypothetical protein